MSRACGLRWLLLVSLLPALAACGYSLRSSDILSTRFDTIQLDLQQPGSEFSRLLRRSLEVAAVEAALVNSAAAVNPDLPLLQVGPEQLESRPVTINPRARAAQVELRLSVRVAMARAEEVLIEPETLFIERVYFEDIENISGNREEAQIITREMRRELVNQLLRRLQASAD